MNEPNDKKDKEREVFTGSLEYSSPHSRSITNTQYDKYTAYLKTEETKVDAIGKISMPLDEEESWTERNHEVAFGKMQDMHESIATLHEGTHPLYKVLNEHAIHELIRELRQDVHELKEQNLFSTNEYLDWLVDEEAKKNKEDEDYDIPF